MDLRLPERPPDARRSGRPSTRCSGRPRAGGTGASAAPPSTATSPAAGHEARRAPAPAAARPPRGQRPRRLDQRGRARLHLPAAHRSPRRGLRRRVLLRDVLAHAACPRGRPRLRRHRLPAGARRRLCAEMEKELGPAGAPGAKKGADLAAQPLPRPVRAGSRRPRVTRAGEEPPRRALGGRDACGAPRMLASAPAAIQAPSPCGHAAVRRLPQFGEPGPAPAAPHRPRRPREPRRLPRPRRLPGAAPGLRARARRASCARSPSRSSSAAAARRSRPAASGTRWRKAPVRPHYLVCNADESRARHLQGPHRSWRRTRSRCRGHDHRRLRHGLRARLPLRARRVSARGPAPRGRHRARPGRGGSWATTSWARASASTSSCAAARAPTSAARRRRSSTRSRAYRGEPRNKPPFPVEVGLFGKPTVVNNVETLVNVLDIVLGSGPAYAAVGTAGSTGTKLFCVSGHVARPGLYEVAFGTTLRALLDGRAGCRRDDARRRSSWAAPRAPS